MTDNDVPDSTDWLSTPLSGIAAVENALRCQVCKDFYKTPMITTCSHTFCSLCIRRALSNDGKCPLCRKPDQALKLRSNWSLEEAVDAFVTARPTTLKLARDGGASVLGGKRKAEVEPTQTSDAPEGKRLRTSSRLRKTPTETAPVDHTLDEDEIVENPDDGDYIPELDDGLVPCPVCQTRMKEWQVFKHLESCPGSTPPSRKRAGESSSTPGFGRIRPQQNRSLERLPALNYSMLREQPLRKKLSELGIPNSGPRHLLESRHKEWVTIWNANCDAARPKKRSELLHDLDVWERTQGGRAPAFGRSVHNAVMVKDKEFDGTAWAAKHDDSFKDLIANARKSRMEARKRAEKAASEPTTESNKEESAAPSPWNSAEIESLSSGTVEATKSASSSAIQHAQQSFLDNPQITHYPPLSEWQPPTMNAKDQQSIGHLGPKPNINEINGIARPPIPLIPQQHDTQLPKGADGNSAHLREV